MDAETARRALKLADGKVISAVMLEREGALSMYEALAQSVDEADLSLGPPSIWSKVSEAVLLEGLLLCAEKRGREAVLDGQPVSTDWLRLHSCLGELYGRVTRGATPARDILVAEVYRLYRSRGHAIFDKVCEQFLANFVQGREHYWSKNMTSGTHQDVLNVIIADKQALYDSYMSFLRNGGLFIQTAQEYRLGDEVLVLLKLLDQPEKLPVAGTVVWVTPQGAQGNRPAGIGIEFSEEDAALNATIQNYLGGTLSADRVTHTL